MKRFLALLAILSIVFLPMTTAAETVSSTATLSVTILPSPVTAIVQPGCLFVVDASSKEALCTLTLFVSDPTLQNAGWKVAVAATDFTCDCGGSLVPNALTVLSAEDVQLINGQEVDRQGGPKLQANSIGQSTTSSQPLFVAKPDYGNGAYSVTMTVRVKVPAGTIPGTYVPIWSVNIADATP